MGSLSLFPVSQVQLTGPEEGTTILMVLILLQTDSHWKDQLSRPAMTQAVGGGPFYTDAVRTLSREPQMEGTRCTCYGDTGL